MQKITFFSIFMSFFCSLSAQSLTDSLKLYFPFTGNSIDESGFGHNAIATGATLTNDRFGNANAAYYFNGISDFIDFTTSKALRPSTLPVTISAWINCNTAPTGSNSYIITSTEYNSLNGFYSGFWFAIVAGGKLQINFGDNNGACSGPYRRTCMGNINVCDGQWHLVTAVVNSSSNMKLYVDCHLDNNLTYSGTGATTPKYSLAPKGKLSAFKCGTTNTASPYFKGKMDELRFYNRALSDAEILTLRNYPTNISNLTLNLGKDTSIFCERVNLVLNATLPNATSYQWSNGQTTPTITVAQTGVYSVVVNVDDCIQVTDTIKVTCKSLNNLSMVEFDSFEVFPNPTKETTNIRYELNDISDVKIELINMLGQVLTVQNYRNEIGRNIHFIATSELTSGIYFIYLSTKNGYSIRKIVVEK